jgi:hypothetical protein
LCGYRYGTSIGKYPSIQNEIRTYHEVQALSLI